jgi:phosphate/sulfate permease
MITRWVLAFEAALGFVIIAVIAKMISMLVQTTLVAVGTIFAIPIRLKRFEGRESGLCLGMALFLKVVR